MCGRLDWRRTALCFWIKRPRRNVSAFRPGLTLGKCTLPWALVIISQTVVGVRERVCAYAKGVGAGTRQIVGTSITAKTPSACVSCGAGKPPSGKPSDARTTRSKPSTPRLNERAGGRPFLCRNPRKILKLRLRVVTSQKSLETGAADRKSV
jgi:hypothetical protein